MFQVGTLVIATKTNYVYTTDKTLCIVERIYNDTEMEARIVGAPVLNSGFGTSFRVDSCNFREITLDDYRKMMQEEGIDFHLSDGVANTLVYSTTKEYDKTPVSTDVVSHIANQLVEILEACEYPGVNYDACYKIVLESVSQKIDLISWLRTSPDWDEDNLRLVRKATMHRDYDPAAINDFRQYVRTQSKRCYKKSEIDGYTYSQAKDLRDMYHATVIDIDNLQNRLSLSTFKEEFGNAGNVCTTEGFNRRTFELLYKKYGKIVSQFAQGDCAEYYITGGEAYEYASVERGGVFKDYLRWLAENPSQIMKDGSWIERLNDAFDAGIVNGQKHSRIILKLAKSMGMTTGDTYEVEDRAHPGVMLTKERWEQEYDKLCSAINPRDFEKNFYISCNPCDFITMSWGNSWTSCYNTDKNHTIGISGLYSDGCCSGGTLSYALDPSSVLTYTLTNDSVSTEYLKARKIARCVFMLTPGQIIQSRMYPQSTDGNAYMYKSFREEMQAQMASCWDITNQWKNIKGSSECMDVCDDSEFVGYLDLEHFDDPNVSYHKEGEMVQRPKQIVIGKKPICPSCGKRHRTTDNIECYSCWSESQEVCNGCGYHYDRDDLHYIDGEYYCDDCCFYCEVHEEYETGDHVYIEDYGDVCEDWFDNNGFSCEYCGEPRIVDDETITAHDGNMFCCDSCAENADYHYVESEGEWYHESDLRYCDSCNEWVLAEDYNSEAEMCEECAANRAEDEQQA